MSSENLKAFDKPLSLIQIFRDEWRWWMLGGLFCFLIGSILMTGWPKGIWPDLSFPYTYHGDGLFISMGILWVMEGWIFDNQRSGYPFGSNFLDFPSSDSGSWLVLKALGSITGDYYSALNLYFLLSFFIVFGASFCVLRALGIFRTLAFTAAFLFTFLPFHFQRLVPYGHVFYVFYWVVPIFFYLGFWIFFNKGLTRFNGIGLVNIVVIIFVFFLLASFGVYYALFGVIVLFTAAILAYFRSLRLSVFIAPLLMIVLIIGGVFINTAPNIVNKIINGTNPDALVNIRSPADPEIYGLKFMQLINPRLDHRIEELKQLTSSYSATSPLVNENSTASLGAVGAIGFIIGFLVLLAKTAGRVVDDRLTLLGSLILILFMFGTIGGFGSLFSFVVTPLIRGWNRISIFIGFGSITIFFFVLQLLIIRFFSITRAKLIFPITALLVGCVGFYDQTAPACIPCNKKTKAIFNKDKEFINVIERSLAPASAIYQLPYMPFPEGAERYLSVGLLHSKELRWSYGGQLGRPGDLFYRALSKESIERQVDVIRRLGFSGIYIDRRGFEDNATLLIRELTQLLGDEPLLQPDDGELVFFKLESFNKIDLNKLSADEIMKVAGYEVDLLGPRHNATLAEGIDFSRRTWPKFLKNVQGLSGPEPWGRWSDANIQHSARFEFFSPLPSKFTLHLVAQPFGFNGVQEILIKVGKQHFRVNLQNPNSEIRLPISLVNEQVYSIEFIPQKPVSPKKLGVSADARKLGIGFILMRFDEE